MLSGFLVIDKPAGITSHDVVSRVRRILDTRKVGHTGTLDPFATGVLPIAVNDGTKAIPFLDEGLKQYEAVMRLGLVTDTLDTTGRTVAHGDWSAVDLAQLNGVIARFTGRISQIPPMFSAIKKDGQPLYKLARQGQQVERQPRDVQIHKLELLRFAAPLVTLRITCSRGTYIRSLADDIGQALGCGAALQELRRTMSGPYLLKHAVSLEELADKADLGLAATLMVTPFEALGHLPDIPLTAEGLGRVKHGRAPQWTETSIVAPPDGALPFAVRLSFQSGLVAVGDVVAPAGSGDPQIVLKRVFV